MHFCSLEIADCTVSFCDTGFWDILLAAVASLICLQLLIQAFFGFKVWIRQHHCRVIFMSLNSEYFPNNLSAHFLYSDSGHIKQSIKINHDYNGCNEKINISILFCHQTPQRLVRWPSCDLAERESLHSELLVSTSSKMSSIKTAWSDCVGERKQLPPNFIRQIAIQPNHFRS